MAEYVKTSKEKVPEMARPAGSTLVSLVLLEVFRRTLVFRQYFVD